MIEIILIVLGVVCAGRILYMRGYRKGVQDIMIEADLKQECMDDLDRLAVVDVMERLIELQTLPKAEREFRHKDPTLYQYHKKYLDDSLYVAINTARKIAAEKTKAIAHVPLGSTGGNEEILKLI